MNYIVDFLMENTGIKWLSTDVQDLFYSVPQDKVLLAVEHSIDTYGDVKF